MLTDSYFTPVFSKNYKINFSQCMPNGNLKYTELCNILQLTAADHADSGKIGFSDMQIHDQAWVLSKIRVEIEKLPKWKDIVTVKTWINDFQGYKAIRAIEVYADNTKIIGATTFWAVFNTKSRKAEITTVPHDHFFTPFSKNYATKTSFSKIDIYRSTKKINTKKVAFSDLDIVNHVNNIKYLEWCLDNIDHKILLREIIKSFDMNFLKELKYAENVTIHQNKNFETNHELYTVSKDDKICFALQISWK